MMQKSDNTAAFLLGNYVVGLPKVQSIIDSWGLSQTDMVNNKTSNKDMELLLRKIYNNNVANPSLTAEMLGFMRDSDFENRIPADLTKDVTVYHKTGDGDTGEVHDVGIVTHGNTAYYIGILTSDAGDATTASQLEAKISKIIYDFMR
jgi:beta-lactamase class A